MTTIPSATLLWTIAPFFLMIDAQASSPARDSAVPDHEALMDHMAGEWLLTGTIAGEHVTHDVDAEWILGRRYVRLHL